MIIWMLMLSADLAQVQPKQATEKLAPGTKRCSDSSVIRATDQCVEWPDHRYLMTHEPPRRLIMQRWWCGQSGKASEARIIMERRQTAARQGPPTTVYSLNSLLIEGRLAPRQLVRSVQKKMAKLDRLYDINGRCLFVRPSGTVPVLVLLYFDEGRQQGLEIPLR